MDIQGAYLKKMFSLSGKTAIITGAAGGIGSYLAEGFARAGAHTAVCDINFSQAESVAKKLCDEGLSAQAFVLDLTSPASIAGLPGQVTARFGGLDILVNCAGVNKREPMLEVEDETFDRIVDVNLKGLFKMSAQAAKWMKEHGGGRIVNYGSLTSAIGLGDVSVYTATKGAVAQLTKTMAVEWAKYGILVNAVCPGFIRTPLTAALWEGPRRSWMLDRIALDRPGTPEDLVGMTVFLCGPAASYITGSVNFVDGGIIAGGKSW